jgi:hypothetical protein
MASDQVTAARDALAHAEALAVKAITDAETGHTAFQLATDLAAAFRQAGDRIAHLRAGAAVRIRDEEALSLRGLADRISVSRARAGQLVAEAEKAGSHG